MQFLKFWFCFFALLLLKQFFVICKTCCIFLCVFFFFIFYPRPTSGNSSSGSTHSISSDEMSASKVGGSDDGKDESEVRVPIPSPAIIKVCLYRIVFNETTGKIPEYFSCQSLKCSDVICYSFPMFIDEYISQFNLL